MAKERSEASKYLSKYGEPGEQLYVSAPQYLAEILVAKRAVKDGIKLPPRFWNDPFYKKDFLFQLKKANDLLKTNIPCDVIIEALNHWRCKYIYSLGLRSVIEPICREIMARKVGISELQEKQQPIELEKRENVPLYKPANGTTGKKSKLRDL